MISIVGMSQTNHTISVSDFDVVENQYLSQCEVGGWQYADWYIEDESNYISFAWTDYEESQCILTSQYYSMELELPGASRIDSLAINISNANWEDENGLPRSTFSEWYLYEDQNTVVEDSDDKGWTSGLRIVDVESEEIVYSISRHDLMQAYDEDSQSILIDVSNLDLPVAFYRLDIFHDEPGTVGFSVGDNDMAFIRNTNSGFKSGNMLTIAEDSFFETGLADPDNPEVILEGVDLFLSIVPVDINIIDVNACDGSEFTINVPCNDSLSYDWRKWSGFWSDSQASGADGCSLTWSLTNAQEEAYYQVTATYGEEVIFTDSITVVIHDNPTIGFSSFPEPVEGVENCFFAVQVSISPESEWTSTDYVWEVTQENAGLQISNADENILQGNIVNFCFDPFISSNDTLGIFVVTAENIFYGCTSIDTTEVVFVDINGDGEWNDLDSLDFRNFIIIPEDTSDTETFVFDRLERQMKLYPNPTNAQVTLEHNFSPGSTLDIMSLTGDLVRREMLNSEKVYLDVSDLPQGVYLAVIYDEKERFTVRLVKQ